MKYHFYILLICLVSHLFLFGQEKKADSLLLLLKKTKTDIVKVQLLNQISDSYKGSDPVKMENYGQQALKLSQKIKYKSIIPFSPCYDHHLKSTLI